MTHYITCPDVALCVNEVGANKSQKSDGTIEGEKLVYPTGTTLKEKVSTKANHWTILGVTLFMVVI